MYTESDHQPPQATVIWLSGGPGCSSMSGALMEKICAIQVGSDGKTTYKLPNSWGDRYSLLFIDQPIGTGYSTRGSGPYRKTTWESADDFVTALDNIRTMHPEWFQRELYIFGESYAGHYVPTYAYQLLKSGTWSALKGIGVGDGLHDGYNQLSHNADQAFALGLVTIAQYQKIKAYEQQARDALLENDYITAGNAFSMVTYSIIVAAGNINPYNSRQFTAPDMPYETEWLNSAEVKRMFGVPQEKNWAMCDMNVNMEYAADIMVSYVDFYDELLKNIRVLLYCGQDDIIVNAASWEEFIRQLKWGEADDFNALNRSPWHIGNDVAGYVKQYSNLTQLIVQKSGHMVPQDQPAISREMIRVFIENIGWEN